MITKIFNTGKTYVRRLVIAAVVVAGITAMPSCSEDASDEVKKGLLATHKSLAFSYAATQYPITVITSMDWEIETACEDIASEDEKWLSTDITSGKSGAAVKVIATRNDSGEERRGTVTITGKTNTVVIPVTQQPDTRNFTDIRFEGELVNFTRATDCKLIVPYREGGGATLKSLSVNVAGASRGSITAETLTDVVLEEGEGTIEFNIYGRTGNTGNLIFTVMGLPSNVYGQSAQCLVEVVYGGEIEDIYVSDVRAEYAAAGTGEHTITAQQRITGTIISDHRYGTTPEDRFVIVDGSLPDCGIVVKCPEAHEYELGDQCQIFIKNTVLKKEDGILVAQIDHMLDIYLTAKEVTVAPVPLSGIDTSGYESMLCSIELSQVDDTDVTKPDYSGNTGLKRFGIKDGYNLYIPSTSEVAQTPMKTGSGVAVGIVGVNKTGKPALLPRSAEDLAGFTGPRYDLSATFYPDNRSFDIIPVSGGTGFSFDLYSSIAWELECDDDWVTVHLTSGPGDPATPYNITFDVEDNNYGRRTAVFTLKGVGVPDLPFLVVQEAAEPVLGVDMSAMLELQTAEMFPFSGGVDYSLLLGDIGLGGWTVSNCYLSRTSLEENADPVLRVGRSNTQGWIETPALSALSAVPTNIEMAFRAGMYATCLDTWIGIEVSGPGTIQTGSGVIYLQNNSEQYPEAKVTVPAYLVTGLSNTVLTPVSIKIAGATNQTKIKLTCTYQSPSATGAVYSFFMSDIAIYYY